MTPVQFGNKLRVVEKAARHIVNDVRLVGQVRDHLGALIEKVTALAVADAEQRKKQQTLVATLQGLQFRYR